MQIGLPTLHILTSEADNCRWDRPVATLQTAVFPAQLAFHAYDPHLVVTNESDQIMYVPNLSLDTPLIKRAHSVYDWLHRKKVSQFFNGNPVGSSITSLHFINEEVGGIILTGAGTFACTICSTLG